VAPAAHASPGIVTLALPAEISSVDLAAQAAATGYAVAYNSRYLLERNWLQIALMGEYSSSRLLELVATLKNVASRLRGRVETDACNA
jgi:aspartate aminotransferase-like enzyme